jgi:hypothetical protein
MPTSGTTTFNPDLLEIIEDAMEMVGQEARAGYDLRTARRSLNLIMREWGNRGLNLWTIVQEFLPWLGGESYYPISADTVDILDCAWRTFIGDQQNDRPLSRYSLSDWTQVSNKGQTGVPTQFFVYRTAAPSILLWPIPAETGTLIIWKIRSIQDAGAYTNNMDIVTRFLPALTAGLAYHMALKTPAATPRIPMLQAEYDRQFALAEEEDRDRASFRMVPDLSSYNR